MAASAANAGTRPRPAASPTVDRVVTQCVYDIATGVWKKGQRLPSVRDAEAHFGCHHLTVLRAYRDLCRMGLVRSVPRSGFYVAESPSVEQVTLHRPRLERLFDRFAAAIREETPLSTLGAFRYLAHLAQSRATQQPECTFVECTQFQARCHAEEITRRLGIPCASQSTAQIGGRPDQVPASVRWLITTSFHIGELATLADPPAMAVVDVVIEPSVEMMRRLQDAKVVTFISLDMANSEKMCRDGRTILKTPRPRFHARQSDEDSLDQTLLSLLHEPDAANEDQRVVLSPSLWEALPQRWAAHRALVPLTYTIREDEWPRLQHALGLPVCTSG